MTETIRIYFDGATGPTNPGHGGAGWVIEAPNEEPVAAYQYLGSNRTNNESEYAALIYALRHGIAIGIEHQRVEIYGDSQLVVNNVNADKPNKKSKMLRLTKIAQELLDSYTDYTLQWIPREENSQADYVSNEALLAHGIKLFKVRNQYK